MKKFTVATLAGALLLLGLPTTHAQVALNVDLEGSWKIVGWTLPDGVPVKNNLPRLTFTGNRVTGTAGCNRVNGTVSIRGDSVTFSALATTRMACTPAVTAQEQVFLNALSGKTLTATRLNDSLTLDTGSGMLNIRRMTIQTP
ncbi:hypothetical protein GCM10008959_27640 [Deinococcus seoulensis]|uniref:DUF306 domain-containing protein n=2 Tax=Deinococcus TaxID=1298 RepID=A0ABQ2RSX9_9DEIO|nr:MULTISPECIES: META domain-containing protein [Deinococcus]GGR63963.1 hypothetical protein GCM10008959_27640 [Deinococcus seoulensis]GGS18207.1 hypothetical protein GCM10008961_07140 [Deinococcus knuensis]